MAAQFTTTYRLRLSRWMMTGTAAAPPATAAAARGEVNRTPIKGGVSMGAGGGLRSRYGRGGAAAERVPEPAGVTPG